MTVETDQLAANKAVVQKLVDAWNVRDVSAMMRYWAPDMVHHGRDGTMPAGLVGSEMQRFIAAFPDIRIDVEDMVAERDLVSTRLTVSATHSGPYLNMEPTGRAVRCALMGQLRIVDGKVVEHWGVADTVHLLEQLGLIDSELLEATA
ncbi:ester cyclase [Nonomuraea sp. 3-1Str]|uniref:ester cyclase n=1 Tax=unclassified Nonomuraea TaxID=2593643 RepID=UPI00285F16AE|nr:ester cyclase [Nonomuraea sp. 3-1Str]MDR8413104.1 ester cyclase [Nonomuraea sp. 3-1Str]